MRTVLHVARWMERNVHERRAHLLGGRDGERLGPNHQSEKLLSGEPIHFTAAINERGMSRYLKFIFIALALPALYGFDPFRSSNRNTEEGNAKLGAGKLKEALDYYEKAVKEAPDEPGAHYNLGLALSGMGQFDRAREELLKATMAPDRALRAKSFYNLGNVHFEQKRYKDAVAAYTRSMQLNPSHRAAKWNLELALRKVQEEKKEEEKKKKEEEKKKKNQQKDKKDKKDNKDNKDNKDKKDDKEQKDKQQKPQPKKDQKQQPEKKEPQRKEEPKPQNQQMEDVLNALDRNDKNLQRKRARMIMGTDNRRPEKDW
jgi:Ca-activated chloride channel homolog